MARQGRRLCAAGLWRSLCPPHRRQLFERRRPAARRDPPPAQERGLSALPDGWIERGIGETRVVLVEDGAIVEARILRDGIIPAGTILAARLIATGPARRRAGRRPGISPPQGRAGRDRRRRADDRGHARGARRRRAVEAAAGARQRRRPGAGARARGPRPALPVADRRARGGRLVRPARRSAQRDRRLRRRRAARRR